MSLLFRLLRIAASVISHGFDPQNPPAQQQRSANRDGHAERQKIAAAINSLREQFESNEQHRNEAEREIRSIDKKRLRTERFVMWTVIIGTAGALVTLFFIKRSTDAAVNAALATETQVDLSKQSLHRDQRAYVFAWGFTLSEEPKPNGSVKIAVGMKNYGKTGAASVVIKARTGITVTEIQSPDWNTIQAKGPYVLHPSGEYTTIADLPNIPPITVTAYQTGTARLYVRIFVTYIDVFKQSHWTEHCSYHVYGQPVMSWDQCETGNDFDRD
jgi:hypothetical protein